MYYVQYLVKMYVAYRYVVIQLISKHLNSHSHAPIAQLVEHWAWVLSIASSIPRGHKHFSIFNIIFLQNYDQGN